MTCTETLHACRCELPADHPPPCVCPCGGSWERLGLQRDLIVHAWPERILEGPLAGLSNTELGAVMAWLGVDAVAFPEGPDQLRVYGDRQGRVLRMDTGQVMEAAPPSPYVRGLEFLAMPGGLARAGALLGIYGLGAADPDPDEDW